MNQIELPCGISSLSQQLFLKTTIILFKMSINRTHVASLIEMDIITSSILNWFCSNTIEIIPIENLLIFNFWTVEIFFSLKMKSNINLSKLVKLLKLLRRKIKPKSCTYHF